MRQFNDCKLNTKSGQDIGALRRLFIRQSPAIIWSILKLWKYRLSLFSLSRLNSSFITDIKTLVVGSNTTAITCQYSVCGGYGGMILRLHFSVKIANVPEKLRGVAIDVRLAELSMGHLDPANVPS